MFILDKEALKRKMEAFIDKADIPGPGYFNESFYCPDQLQDHKEAMLQKYHYEHKMMQQHIDTYIKPLISSVVNELINQMYGHDEFEKDLGLK